MVVTRPPALATVINRVLRENEITPYGLAKALGYVNSNKKSDEAQCKQLYRFLRGETPNAPASRKEFAKALVSLCPRSYDLPLRDLL